MGRFLKQVLISHAAFWITLIATLTLFGFVAQVRNVWFQWWRSGESTRLVAGTLLFLALLLAFYIASPFLVINRRGPRRLANGRRRWLTPLADVLTGQWFVPLVSRADPNGPADEATSSRQLRGRFPLAAGVLFCLTLIIVVWGAEADGSRAYTLAGAFCQNIGSLSLLVALWLVGWEAWRRRTGSAALTEVARLQARVLGWLLVAGAVGEGLWVLAATHTTGVPYQLYSVWAYLHVLSLAVILGRLVDRWDALSDWPVRPAALFLVPASGLLINGPYAIGPDDHLRHLTAAERAADRARPRHSRPDERDQAWFDHFRRRLEAIPEKDGGPAVIVACSGGGSRAAIFTALVLEGLARTPLLDPRAPIVAGDDRPARTRTWGDNVVLISGVSGGSLASAHYVHRLGPPGPDDGLIDLSAILAPVAGGRLRNTNTGHLVGQLRVIAEEELVRGFSENPLPTLPGWSDHEWGPEWGDNPRRRQANLAYLRDTAFRALRDERPTSPGRREATRKHLLALLWCDHFARTATGQNVPEVPGAAERQASWEWLLHSTGFDAMGTDFMAPIVRGAVTPMLDRGAALTLFWTSEFDWWDSTNFRGYNGRHRRVGYGPQHPLLVLNACNATRGTRLAVGFPPLPANLWSDGYANQEDGLLSPESASREFPEQELSLSRAVRMSSNFPWGLRVLSFPTSRPDQAAHVLDGGVVDNTGLDTVYAIFDALRFHAGEPRRFSQRHDGGEEPRYRKSSQEILKGLRARGVVLVEIDAGAKPDENMPPRLLSYLVEPGQSLTNATYTNAVQTRQLYLDETKSILTAPEARQATSASASGAPRAFNVRLQCNHYRPGTRGPSSDVMTAWALGPIDKAQVVFRFLVEFVRWDDDRRNIAGWYETAQGATAGRPGAVGDLEARVAALGRMLDALKRPDEVPSLRKQLTQLQAKAAALAERWRRGEERGQVTRELSEALAEYRNSVQSALQERLNEGAKTSRDAFDRPRK